MMRQNARLDFRGRSKDEYSIHEAGVRLAPPAASIFKPEDSLVVAAQNLKRSIYFCRLLRICCACLPPSKILPGMLFLLLDPAGFQMRVSETSRNTSGFFTFLIIIGQ